MDKKINKSKIKFKIEDKSPRIIPLQDGRILIYQKYDVGNEEKNKACVYNLNYDFVICDIYMDAEYPGRWKMII